MVSFAANASTTNLNNLNISTIVQEDEQAMLLQNLHLSHKSLKSVLLKVDQALWVLY